MHIFYNFMLHEPTFHINCEQLYGILCFFWRRVVCIDVNPSQLAAKESLPIGPKYEILLRNAHQPFKQCKNASCFFRCFLEIYTVQISSCICTIYICSNIWNVFTQSFHLIFFFKMDGHRDVRLCYRRVCSSFRSQGG